MPRDDLDIELVADRLTLRTPGEEDVDELAELADDPEIARFTFVPSPYDRGDAERFVERARDLIGVGDAYPLVVELRDGGDVAGIMALEPVDEEDLRADVGYWIGEPYRGQGLAGEALDRVLEFAFDGLGMERVQARVLPGNQRSVTLLENRGFRREGRLRRHVRHRGERKDEIRYGLLADEWRGD